MPEADRDARRSLAWSLADVDWIEGPLYGKSWHFLDGRSSPSSASDHADSVPQARCAASRCLATHRPSTSGSLRCSTGTRPIRFSSASEFDASWPASPSG